MSDYHGDDGSMETDITVIGAGTHIKGEMHFDTAARILGSFEGRITAKGEVHVGRGAVCKASVEGSCVVVDGRVEGDILAHEMVQLNADSLVKGDVTAPRMIVADGSSFSGNCRVGPDAAGQARKEKSAAMVEVVPQENGAVNYRHEAPATRNGSADRVETARQRLAEAQARLSRFSSDEQGDGDEG